MSREKYSSEIPRPPPGKKLKPADVAAATEQRRRKLAARDDDPRWKEDFTRQEVEAATSDPEIIERRDAGIRYMAAWGEAGEKGAEQGLVRRLIAEYQEHGRSKQKAAELLKAYLRENFGRLPTDRTIRSWFKEFWRT
jgi:hypothetical protein